MLPFDTADTKMDELAVNIGISLVRGGVALYDIITYPLYALIQKPWQQKKLIHRTRVRISSSALSEKYRAGDMLMLLGRELYPTYNLIVKSPNHCFVFKSQRCNYHGDMPPARFTRQCYLCML